MALPDQALRALGQMIRAARAESELTQENLGRKAGIVGKYVSEIERGTRDVPFSTLLAVVEEGLDRRLEIQFVPTDAPRAKTISTLPPVIAQLARDIATLPALQRGDVIAVLRHALKLARS